MFTHLSDLNCSDLQLCWKCHYEKNNLSLFCTSPCNPQKDSILCCTCNLFPKIIPSEYFLMLDKGVKRWRIKYTEKSKVCDKLNKIDQKIRKDITSLSVIERSELLIIAKQTKERNIVGTYITGRADSGETSKKYFFFKLICT